MRKRSTNFPGGPSHKVPTRASTRRQAKCRNLLQGGSIWWTAELASSMKPCASGCLSQGDTREGMGSERLGICSHSFTCGVGKTHAFSQSLHPSTTGCGGLATNISSHPPNTCSQQLRLLSPRYPLLMPARMRALPAGRGCGGQAGLGWLFPA